MNLMTRPICAFQLFWRQHPALFYGIASLLGFFTAFKKEPWVLVPILFLYSPFFPTKEDKKKLYTGILLTLASAVYGFSAFLLPQLPEEGVKGIAAVSFSSVQKKSSHNRSHWIYRGQIWKFTANEGLGLIGKNIPFQVAVSEKSDPARPPASQNYAIYGTLKQTEAGTYILKTAPKTSWSAMPGSWNLSELRYSIKKSFKDYLLRSMRNGKAASFLNGIATGEFDDRMLAFEFGRFGLQHLMAISGFHFAAVAAAAAFIFKGLLKYKPAAAAILILSTAYCLFLGTSPSILRAWIMISLALANNLFERRSSSLNSLGAALLISLLLDPPSCLHLGFQFSFMATAAILLFYPCMDLALSNIFRKRSLSEAIEMSRIDQHGYCLLSLFRQALALMIAVNFTVLPMTLFFFGQFPLMSLLYNLFFPFLVSLSLFLLLFGSLFSFLPYVPDFIHWLNERYTQGILNLTYNLPKKFDVYWRVADLPGWFLILFFSVLFSLGVLWRYALHIKKEESKDFCFI